jgi:apolipoprotein N-acyltransferase
MENSRKYFIAAGLSGLLLALAYPGWPLNLGFLAWIGLMPLFWGIKNLQFYHDRDKIEGFLFGFFAGLVYFLIIFRWFWSIHPLDTLGIQNNLASFVIVLLVYIISSAGMAVFWGLFGLVYSLQLTAYSKKLGNWKLETGNWKLFLLAPVLFVLLEYARSYGFGLLWAGSGTLFGPHWTLGNLTYALANNPLILRLASLVGIYGLTFLVVLVNSALMVIFTRSCKNYHGKIVGVLLPVVLTATVLAAVEFLPKTLWLSKQKAAADNERINFAVIQTNQPTKISPAPKETLNAFKEQLDLLKQVAQRHPESQLIIFPEASDFFKNLSLFLTGAQIQNYFSNLFKEPRLIISGARIVDADSHAYSRVFSLDTQKDIISFYDKRLLTPQGEFLSYPTRFIVNLLSKTKVSEFGALRELSIGKEKISTINFRGQFSAAPLVCSEILSPGLTRKTTQGADIIVEMASYGIFHGNTVLVKQNLAAARLRAAENRKPLITASNMGLSYAIESAGNIAKIAPNQAPQILTGNVAIGPQKSWYNGVGDTLVLLGCLGLLIYFAVFSLARSKGADFNV